MNLGQTLWQLTITTQNLEALSNEDLTEAYKLALIAHHHSLNERVSSTERRWALHLLEDVEIEIKHRNLTMIFMFILMDETGNFINGRDELKKMFAKMSFDDMVQLADELCLNCKNDKQREAIIEIEREIVTMTN